LKWFDLHFGWQTSFEEAWKAYCTGCVPVGAAVLDDENNLIGKGRNRIAESNQTALQVGAHRLAHAELNALLNVRDPDVDIHACSMYTMLEPCPLCMGAIYMSGIRRLYYAARDPYAGSTNMLGTTAYLSKKPIEVFPPEDAELEQVSIALNTDYMWRSDPQRAPSFLDVWRPLVAEGVRLGEHLYKTHFYKRTNSSRYSALEAYQLIFEENKKLL
jgi:tRNA(adenine34) deaminase